MGARNTIPASNHSPTFTNTTKDDGSNFTNGVRVNGQVFSETRDVDEMIKSAYQKGKNDAMEDFDKKFQMVAAEVYDNVTEQLSALSAKRLDDTTRLV